ncbi:transglutaminase-like domain-containing protein [Flavobacterium sp. J27]|uniref:transglutaminase-like domain-containing protein n=1 Tax=Flavobacterium sp. J27 TaxID=2060419 RepID=UPI001030124F|nr:transglutaminase-like domain-containing protein [Flavobacterium sp. J27]
MDIVTEVNTALYRPLKPGFQYDKLMPEFQNSVYHFDSKNQNSTTFNTLQFMQQWTLRYYKQLEKVAPLLQGKSTAQTVSNIYTWLYSHFQYNIDTNVQKLFSPSSAWYYRKQGIDCKSYSILASCLLLNLKIPHAFRKVKLKGSTKWSHVYVVVPQGNTYYVIDATTHQNREVNFNEKYDLSMSGLTHIGLASPYENTYDASYYDSLNCSCQDNPNNGLHGISDMFSNVTSLFSTPMNCWGGSGFDSGQAQFAIDHSAVFFKGLIQKINTAVANNEVNVLSQLDTEFYGIVKAGLCGYDKKIWEKDWNDCTDASIHAVVNFLKFYRDIVLKGYEAWLNQYYTIENVSTKRYNNRNIEGNPYYLYFAYTDSGCELDIPVRSFTIKEGVTEITQFEFTPYIVQAVTNPSSFNLPEFLNSLNTVLTTYQNTVGGGGTTGNYSDSGSEDFSNNGNGANEPEGSGVNTGVVVGGTLLVGGILYYLNNRKKTTANV